MRRFSIITGPRDSGKTRAAALLAAALSTAGTTVGGVLAEAQVEQGRKLGYSFRDIMSNQRMQYAVRRPDTPGAAAGPGAEPAQGSGQGFAFLEEGLAFGRASVARAMTAAATVIIVDEMGPLEMKGDGLWSVVEEAAARFPGSIVLTVRPGLVEQLCARLGASDEDVRVVSPAEAPDLSG